MVTSKLQLSQLQIGGCIHGLLILSRYQNFPIYSHLQSRYFTEVIYKEHNIPEHTALLVTNV